MPKFKVTSYVYAPPTLVITVGLQGSELPVIGIGPLAGVGLGVGLTILLFAKLNPLSGPANCAVLNPFVDPSTLIHKAADVGEGVGNGVSLGDGEGVSVGEAVGIGVSLGEGAGVAVGPPVGPGVGVGVAMATAILKPSCGADKATAVKSTFVNTEIQLGILTPQYGDYRVIY